MAEQLLGGGLAGSFLGVGKYASDVAANKNDRDFNSQVIKYSPWTGMKAGETRKANAFNDMLQGMTAGMQMAQANPGFMKSLGIGGAEGGGAAGGARGISSEPESISPWAAMDASGAAGGRYDMGY